ncbi:unnamed protein product [Pneumocystis jirovecii]|uniref:Uncharacterized protein n=1 Tax=Pneumocystis jirovecii TaxID=42068 RepID=L0PBI6_PNEJI|nr:unnamed protein product [Pneumocystis jirovecii]
MLLTRLENGHLGIQPLHLNTVYPLLEEVLLLLRKIQEYKCDLPSVVYVPYLLSMKSLWFSRIWPLERKSYTPLPGIELKSPHIINGILVPEEYAGRSSFHSKSKASSNILDGFLRIGIFA